MKKVYKIITLSAITAFGLCCFAINVHAQAKKITTAKKATVQAHSSNSSAGFKKLPSGLEYKIVKHGKGTRKPAFNDQVEINIHVHIGDSVIFDSRKMYNNKPVPFPIAKPKFKGDPIEGFMLLVAGDSAVFKLSVDSLQKAGNSLMPWMKSGDKVEYDVEMVSVMTAEEAKKEADKKASAQKTIDEKLLQEYFKKNNITPMKTASGLYYTISQTGSGPATKAGQTVKVNYTGKLLNSSKPFDSNVDPAFNHQTPFEVELGKGKVIKGWDEGLALFNKGTKATLYIPSELAYGSQDRSPTIPANSILVFDVEILDIGTAAGSQNEIDDKLIQDYLAKNNIQANKTKSGVYYTISQEGTGDKATPGEKVTVTYTGKTLDGKTFDSNVGKKPFSFSLGAGQVIKGWDEGVQQFKKGSKGTLYIPSGLAYGPQAHPPVIPKNAVLVFDIEITDMSN